MCIHLENTEGALGEAVTERHVKRRGRVMLMYGRDQYNIVKQLSFH